jgi:hypothetical protein
VAKASYLLNIPSYRLMVRTLDFHSKNAGSNPASLTIISTNLPTNHRTYITLNKDLRLIKPNPTQKTFLRKNVKYCFNFASLISPFSIKPSRLVNPTGDLTTRKLYVKQSYMLITWFSYLTNNPIFNNKSEAEDLDNKELDLIRPGFFVQPVRVFKTTMTKAPMAHKTFSQEQYLIKFYKLSASFTFPVKFTAEKLTLNQSIFIFLSFRLNSFFTGSNLFVMKKSKLTLLVGDKNFVKTLN